MLTRNGQTAEDHLPEVDPFLSHCFYLSGMISSSSGGISPLSWSEMQAFILTTGYKLSGWESEQIMNMSRNYYVMAKKANEIGCPAPYVVANPFQDEESLAKMRDRVSRQWDSFTGGLKNKKAI